MMRIWAGRWNAVECRRCSSSGFSGGSQKQIWRCGCGDGFRGRQRRRRSNRAQQAVGLIFGGFIML